MLFGPLRIDESTKSNMLSSISPGYWQTGLQIWLFTSEHCSSNNFYCLNSKIFKILFFILEGFVFFQNYEKLIFSTQLVPTTSGSNIYTSTLKM